MGNWNETPKAVDLALMSGWYRSIAHGPEDQERGMKETLLYGLPKDATKRYEEVLLLTNATAPLIEKVKALGARIDLHDVCRETGLSRRQWVDACSPHSPAYFRKDGEGTVVPS